MSDSLGFLVDNLGKQTAAYQFFKAPQKTMQMAEIALNLEGELSLNAKATAKTGVLLGPAAATQPAISNALSIGRAVVSGVKVAAFAKGGNTADPSKRMSLASAAGSAHGASGGSFAPGGPISGPTLGIIGEAGAELVIPN